MSDVRWDGKCKGNIVISGTIFYFAKSALRNVHCYFKTRRSVADNSQLGPSERDIFPKMIDTPGANSNLLTKSEHKCRHCAPL